MTGELFDIVSAVVGEGGIWVVAAAISAEKNGQIDHAGYHTIKLLYRSLDHIHLLFTDYIVS